MNAATLTRPGVAWAALAALLAAGAVVVQWAVPAHAVDWEPARWLTQPWRAWTAAFVHLSPLHFGTNLLAIALLAAFGVVAGVPARTAVAWGAAWPLTHLGLFTMPALQHYGGLSGLVHAGAAAAALHLAATGPRWPRAIGFAALGLIGAKVLSETPWRAAVQTSAQWDIPVAPIAHLTGAVAGTACSAAAEAWRRRHG